MGRDFTICLSSLNGNQLRNVTQSQPIRSLKYSNKEKNGPMRFHSGRSYSMPQIKKVCQLLWLWLVHTDSDFIAGGVARHSHVELPCTCHQKCLYVNKTNVQAYTNCTHIQKIMEAITK